MATKRDRQGRKLSWGQDGAAKGRFFAGFAAGALAGVLTLGGLGLGKTAWADEPVPPACGTAALEEAMKKAKAQEAAAAATDETIEIAILLDTSGSMDGLIHQARSHLWSIVNRLAKAERGGKQPALKVAVYEYGNNRLSAESGFLREVTPLTDDLDLVSERLFGLTTSGGSEHCGQAIAAATASLAWGTGDAFRAIFIAGNEPFSQGPVPYAEACKQAIAKGIIVNTIHCGDEAAGREGAWDQAARLADGRFTNIDPNAVAMVATPFDDRLGALSAELSKTYVAFGHRGEERKARQEAQDEAVGAASPAAAAERGVAKASGLYKASEWDLVDAVDEKKLDLEKAKDEELPEAFRGLTPEARLAKVEELKAERAKVQAEIAKLQQEREAFLEKARAESADAGVKNLDKAVQEMLDAQLGKRGYKTKT